MYLKYAKVALINTKKQTKNLASDYNYKSLPSGLKSDRVKGQLWVIMSTEFWPKMTLKVSTERHKIPFHFIMRVTE